MADNIDKIETDISAGGLKEKFAHLHVHTQYSLLDGAAKIEDLFKLCDKMDMPAVAITDHGNMYGVLEFVKRAAAYTDPKADFYDFIKERRPFKIKPIVGCEVYVAENLNVKTSVGGKMPKYNHLVLLCKNETGYLNLIKLVSYSYTKGLYYKPRIDMELLKKHTEGLVCLSACLAGAIPQAILGNELEKADAVAKEFKRLFKDDFYIEIQDHNIKAQKQVLPYLVRIARDNGIKLVATNDVHYLTKADSAMQKVLQCISFRTTMPYEEATAADYSDNPSLSEGGTEDDGYFPTKEFYLKSRAEMELIFPALKEALDNTLEIADKCEPYFFQKEPLLPLYLPADGSEPFEFLRKLTYEGMKAKFKEVTPQVKQRADYELNIIKNMGFVEYFLIVWDFIHYAETNGIPVGPGRGSGVGSIVAYSIGITKVDPLKYELIFERFLNPERVSNPDFDIDFCVDRRGDVIDYVIGRYGADNVSQIVTFGTLAAKAAVKDVGRVYSQPYSEVEKITKLIPMMMGKKHIGHLLGILAGKDGEPSPVIPELKEMYETDDMVKNILDMAMKIEGMPRQTGMHAAGVIICKDPIYEHIPLSMTSDNIVTTEFNMIECEELGLLKMDFLGLRTLTDIKKAIDIIKITQGKDIDFYNMDYDDKGVFELIGEGDTHAVFQLESEGMKRFMRELKPTCLEDIIAGISLYRPGPMDKIPQYVFGKKNPGRIKYDHDLQKPILEVTYGVMVYQEQVMKTVQVLAGYTLGRADELRRIMSKKKKDKMEAERIVFLNGISAKDNKGVEICGAVKNGVPADIANKIFDDMTSFASYAFNKSHAAAYAFLAYQTAYLKRYYTVEFIAAVLNNRITSIDEIRNYLTYLKEKDIAVLPPDINKSGVDFTVERGAIRIGMAAIKNVGAAIIAEIVKERENGGEFTDFVQFVNRMSGVTLNKKMLESLIFAGTFDCFKKHRSQLIQVYESVLDRAGKDKAAAMRGQFSFFESEVFSAVDKFDYPSVAEYSHSDKLRYEKEVAGVYLTGHPLDEYKEYLKQFKFNASHFAAKKEDAEEAPLAGDDGQVSENAVSDGMTVTVGGMLVEAEKKLTKSGKDLGIGRLEDLYGTIEILCSGHTLNKLKGVWQKDKLVSVTGKVKERDGEFSVWVDKLDEFKGGKQEKKNTRKICFYVSFINDDEKIIDKIQEIINIYPGDDETYLKNTDEGKTFSLGLTCGICDLMLNELAGLLGADRVKVAN